MSKMTIYKLAEELNMSPSMVSRALSPNGKVREDKRQIILEAAKKYDFTPNTFASRLSMDTIKIGILLSSRFPINTQYMLDGISEAYQSFKDYKIEYDVTTIENPHPDAEYIRQLLSKYAYYDGVIITGMSSNRFTEVINDFVAVQPQTVQVQAINEKANCLFSSCHDEFVASGLAAEFLHNCLRKSPRKNVLLFTGNMESALHKKAAQAFLHHSEEFGLNVLDNIDMMDNAKYFEEILPDLINKYKDQVDGMYITSGISLPLCKNISKFGDDIPFVTFDIYDEIKKYMKENVVSATIYQDVHNQMKKAFEALVLCIIYGTIPPKKIYTDVSLVLKSNMDLFK